MQDMLTQKSLGLSICNWSGQCFHTTNMESFGFGSFYVYQYFFNCQGKNSFTHISSLWKLFHFSFSFSDLTSADLHSWCVNVCTCDINWGLILNNTSIICQRDMYICLKYISSLHYIQMECRQLKIFLRESCICKLILTNCLHFLSEASKERKSGPLFYTHCKEEKSIKNISYITWLGFEKLNKYYRITWKLKM